jgi:hypothetical protein
MLLVLAGLVFALLAVLETVRASSNVEACDSDA